MVVVEVVVVAADELTCLLRSQESPWAERLLSFSNGLNAIVHVFLLAAPTRSIKLMQIFLFASARVAYSV